jgi:molybdopterin synthase sulfur carrier subunit
MAVKVKLLASLGERHDRREAVIDHVPGMRVADVWDLVTSGAAMAPNTLTAINFEYCRRDAAVADGDEVAFFPPVTGG